MTSKHTKLLSITLLLYVLPLLILLNFPPRITAQECPYPCYPPPTGPAGKNPPPATTTPPSPQGGGGYVPNPPSTTNPTPPAGSDNNNPYVNSPPDYVNGEAPPPPEPIVPWFPFYYRKPPHADVGQTSASSISLQESRTMKMMIIITTIFPLILLFH